MCGLLELVEESVLVSKEVLEVMIGFLGRVLRDPTAEGILVATSLHEDGFGCIDDGVWCDGPSGRCNVFCRVVNLLKGDGDGRVGVNGLCHSVEHSVDFLCADAAEKTVKLSENVKDGASCEAVGNVMKGCKVSIFDCIFELGKEDPLDIVSDCTVLFHQLVVVKILGILLDLSNNYGRRGSYLGRPVVYLAGAIIVLGREFSKASMALSGGSTLDASGSIADQLIL